MSSEEEKISTYLEFIQLLPQIKQQGYTAIQIMGIQEHSYYASYGYQVTNFFAPSSRFGTPVELKKMIDEAHSLNLLVLLDIVHSHSSSNIYDGLNNFDGSDNLYFIKGKEGTHSLWDGKLFDYASYEVLRFLLKFNFDGFRFDGITSMLYKHHGINIKFSGQYEDYFNQNLNYAAITYLMLANDLIHSILPQAITIAEDVSGLPTLCRPLNYGGLGFDFRFHMGLPDYWFQIIKQKDED